MNAQDSPVYVAIFLAGRGDGSQRVRKTLETRRCHGGQKLRDAEGVLLRGDGCDFFDRQIVSTEFLAGVAVDLQVDKAGGDPRQTLRSGMCGRGGADSSDPSACDVHLNGLAGPVISPEEMHDSNFAKAAAAPLRRAVVITTTTRRTRTTIERECDRINTAQTPQPTPKFAWAVTWLCTGVFIRGNA